MKTSCWTPVSLIASITLSSFFVAWMPKVEAQQTLLSENSNTLNKFSVGALIEKLRLANPNQRYEIIQVLKSRGRNAIPALIVALGTPDPLVCSGAAETLGQLGEEASMAVPALIKLLQDNRRALTINETQNNYPLLSSFIPPLRSFPRLSVSGRPFVREIPTAPDNPRHLVKVYALAAIGQIGGSARTTATSSITPLLQDTDPWVRLNAAWSLTQIGAEIPVLSVYLEALQDPDPAVRSSTAKVIQDGGALLEKVIGVEATPDTAVSLVKGLADPENSVRSAAISLLKIMGRDSVPALTVALKQSDPLVRLEAAKTLGQIGPSAGSALPTLALLIQDQERYVDPPNQTPSVFLFFPSLCHWTIQLF
jgi:HEAT repeat protein